MSQKKVDLGKYNTSNYNPGAGPTRRILWYFVNAIFLYSWLLPVSSLKCRLLVLFGARIGKGVVIKPRVNIKYPWHLVVGDNVWIGEGAWIDNLVRVTLGNNVCISQNAYLLTGNHDYKDVVFGLIAEEITIDQGAWVGACSIVCPGVHMFEHSILSVGSVLTKNTEPCGIYQGNPAKHIRKRIIR